MQNPHTLNHYAGCDAQGPFHGPCHNIHIHPYDELLQTRWKGEPAYRIFDRERVVRIPRAFPEGVLEKIADPEWRRNVACLENDECFPRRGGPKELNEVNEALGKYCRSVLDSVFQDHQHKPEYLGIYDWIIRHEDRQPGTEDNEPVIYVHADVTASNVRQLFRPLSTNPEDVLAWYNIHFFLHQENRGSGLAFLLHSSLSQDKSELVTNPKSTVLLVQRRVHHVWVTEPRMKDAHAMLFCSASTCNNVAFHTAYPVDTSAADYVPRRSFEVRMFVREHPGSGHLVHRTDVPYGAPSTSHPTPLPHTPQLSPSRNHGEQRSPLAPKPGAGVTKPSQFKGQRKPGGGS